MGWYVIDLGEEFLAEDGTPIELQYRVTFHKVRKPRSDYYARRMKNGERYAAISGPTPEIPSEWSAVQIRKGRQSERDIIAEFKDRGPFYKNMSHFLWAVKSRSSWPTRYDFLKFYYSTDHRAKVCIDCGRTGRQLGLRGDKGNWNWHYVFDQPGKFRCHECWTRNIPAKTRLIQTVFGPSDRLPFWP